MKEYVGVLIGVVVGFGLGLCRELWIEKKRRKTERQGRCDALLSTIRDQKAVIGKNIALIEPARRDGEIGKILISHRADTWRWMLNTGEMEFLGDNIVPRSRKVCVILQEADGYIAQISTLELELGAGAVKEARTKIGTLKEVLKLLYYFEDGSVLQKLQEIERSLEGERRKLS